jgi:hypothetical protein
VLRQWRCDGKEKFRRNRRVKADWSDIVEHKEAERWSGGQRKNYEEHTARKKVNV